MRKQEGRGGEWDPLATRAGELDRGYPTTAIAVPRAVSLDMEETILRWSPAYDWVYQEPTFGMLADFVDLGTASPSGILGFARRWGVLGFCEHGLPASHDLLSPTGRTFGCDPLRDEKSLRTGGGWEPLSLWRDYARWARAILSAAVEIGGGSPDVPGCDSEFVRSGLAMESVTGPYAVQRRAPSCQDIAEGVNRWLALGDVRPAVWPGEDETAELTILYGGAESGYRPECRLFGALAIQLMQSVTGDTLPVRCPCGRLFKRTKRNRKYCLKCGKKGRWRKSSKRYYESQKKKRLARSGSTLALSGER